MSTTSDKPTARETFREGQPVREAGGHRRGVVAGFGLHPGEVAVSVADPSHPDCSRLSVSHMSLWVPALTLARG